MTSCITTNTTIVATMVIAACSTTAVTRVIDPEPDPDGPDEG